MKNLGKNSNGFISLNFIFVITLFLTLYFTIGFSLAVSNARELARTTCLNEATDGQALVLKILRKLFDLNYISSSLRYSIELAEIERDLNWELPPVVAALEAEILELKIEQKALDITQKALIQAARVALMKNHAKIILDMNKSSNTYNNQWRSVLSLLSLTQPNQIPQLAIRPDVAGDVGPNYEWLENSTQVQAMSYSWSLFYHTNSRFQTLLNWTNTLSMNCTVAPITDGEDSWSLKITTDKF